MTQKENISFENAFERLEEILEKMNSGELSLADSISLFEEADKLIKGCDKQLSQAEQKIQKLIKDRQGELLSSEEGEYLSESL